MTQKEGLSRKNLYSTTEFEPFEGSDQAVVFEDRDGTDTVIPTIPQVRRVMKFWEARWINLENELNQYPIEFIKMDAKKDVKKSSASFAKAFKEIYREYMDDPQGNIILTGTAGSGKTLIAAMTRIHAPLPGMFLDVTTLVDEIFHRYSNGDLARMKQTIKTVPLLVLDDLGAETPGQTKAIQSHLYNLINFRYRFQLPTIVTSNLSIEELRASLPRIMDRLMHNARVYEIKVPKSWRQS